MQCVAETVSSALHRFEFDLISQTMPADVGMNGGICAEILVMI